jgi:hypothetical protein
MNTLTIVFLVAGLVAIAAPGRTGPVRRALTIALQRCLTGGRR